MFAGAADKSAKKGVKKVDDSLPTGGFGSSSEDEGDVMAYLAAGTQNGTKNGNSPRKQ